MIILILNVKNMAKKGRGKSPEDATPPVDTPETEPTETVLERSTRLGKEARESRERFLAAEAARVEAEEREKETRGREPGVREKAKREAVSSERRKITHEIQVGPADGEKPVLGQEAKILIENSVGESVDLLSVFQGINPEKIKIVFGTKLETSTDNLVAKEGDPKKIKIPMDFSSRDLPYLIREITRAVYDNETIIAEGITGNDEKKTRDRKIQTVRGKIIHKELESRQKKEQGLEKIRDEYGTKYFRDLRKRYEELETKHSKDSLSAERIVGELAEPLISQFRDKIGTDLFVDYGGWDGFKEQLELDTLVRQSELVHQFDEDKNLALLGRPAIDVKKIQPISALEFFSGWYSLKSLYHGPGWDLPMVEGRIGSAIRDSETVKDWELLKKIHNVPKDSSLLENKEVIKKIVSEHWKTPFVPALMAAELGLKPIRYGLKKARHWLSKGLFDLHEMTGKLFMGKSWKPKWKTEEELDKKKEDDYKKLFERAMGKQA